jgi:hypothetical protein
MARRIYVSDLLYYPLRMYWDSILFKCVMGNQIKKVLGVIIVFVIVTLIMVLPTEQDRWQTMW